MTLLSERPQSRVFVVRTERSPLVTAGTPRAAAPAGARAACHRWLTGSGLVGAFTARRLGRFLTPFSLSHRSIALRICSLSSTPSRSFTAFRPSDCWSSIQNEYRRRGVIAAYSIVYTLPCQLLDRASLSSRGVSLGQKPARFCTILLHQEPKHPCHRSTRMSRGTYRRRSVFMKFATLFTMRRAVIGSLCLGRWPS